VIHDLTHCSERKSRRQRRASSDILKSPKEAASSLFSKLSFSTELLNSKSLQTVTSGSLGLQGGSNLFGQKLSSSNYSLNRPLTSSHISLGSSHAGCETGSIQSQEGRISRWQISFDAVLGKPNYQPVAR